MSHPLLNILPEVQKALQVVIDKEMPWAPEAKLLMKRFF